MRNLSGILAAFLEETVQPLPAIAAVTQQLPFAGGSMDRDVSRSLVDLVIKAGLAIDKASEPAYVRVEKRFQSSARGVVK